MKTEILDRAMAVGHMRLLSATIDLRSRQVAVDFKRDHRVQLDAKVSSAAANADPTTDNLCITARCSVALPAQSFSQISSHLFGERANGLSFDAHAHGAAVEPVGARDEGREASNFDALLGVAADNRCPACPGVRVLQSPGIHIRHSRPGVQIVLASPLKPDPASVGV